MREGSFPETLSRHLSSGGFSEHRPSSSRNQFRDASAHQALEADAEIEESGRVLSMGILHIRFGIESLDLGCCLRKPADEAPALILRHAEDPFGLLDKFRS